VNAMLSPWYRTFLSINPPEYLPKVKCPVLALNGKKDLQVPYKEDLDNIEKLLSKNKQHQTKAYENLNHLFQHCETGLPSEYGSNEETFSPEVLNDIVNWLNQLK
ncbi:MAG: dienelactone hydrolase family protein, partial [Bacteroidia bacterium]|nr:dienelactone hydrolase family protein [Bacteroidia bacterium]